MSKLSKEQLTAIKDSFEVSSFCKKWWKSLSKEIKKARISNFLKVQVYCKICEGLLNESRSCVESPADEEFIDDMLKYQLGLFHE